MEVVGFAGCFLGEFGVRIPPPCLFWGCVSTACSTRGAWLFVACLYGAVKRLRNEEGPGGVGRGLSGRFFHGKFCRRVTYCPCFCTTVPWLLTFRSALFKLV